jgi:hypothetical protein
MGAGPKNFIGMLPIIATSAIESMIGTIATV